MLPAALNAFGTASSSATLPISKRCADEMEVPNEISSLALPLGATINMDAVSIVMSFMIVFFANATGTELSYGLLAVVLLFNALLSIGAPGVPNSAIASFAALAAIAGLPMGIMGMYELKKLPEAVSEFDEALWGSLVEYVTVSKDKTMVFTLLGGTEITA